MEKLLSDHLKTLADRFLGATGLKLTTIGRLAAGDWRFFRNLDDEAKGFNIKTYDRIVQWFSDNWPDQIEWPVLRIGERGRPPKQSATSSGLEPANA